MALSKPLLFKIIAGIWLLGAFFFLKDLIRENEVISNSLSVIAIPGRPLSADLPQESVSKNIIDATHNETLGFSKIFYISLPYRTDRQDGMTLLAKTTNLSLTYQPGVIGKEINDKAKPVKEGTELKPEQWGCWRSHVDLWRKIVEENIETALIVEDDLDWDVNIKDVMHRMATQLRTGDLRNTTMSEFEKTSAPYGLDWDTLHLGTCFDFPAHPLPKYIQYSDPHSPGRKELNDVYLSHLEAMWHVEVNDSTAVRILAPSWNPVCTIGYAVTQRGAQRLLYNVGTLPVGDPVDVGMLLALQRGVVKGYSLIPPPLTTWKLGGSQAGRDSDIDSVDEQNGKGMIMEGSRNLRNSARVAMRNKFETVQVDIAGPIDKQRADYHYNIEKEQWQAAEKAKAEEEKKKQERQREQQKKKQEEEAAKQKAQAEAERINAEQEKKRKAQQEAAEKINAEQEEKLKGQKAAAQPEGEKKEAEQKAAEPEEKKKEEQPAAETPKPDDKKEDKKDSENKEKEG